MIIDEMKLIFVHIQKTGGNSVSDALAQSVVHPTKHFTAAELRSVAGEDVWKSYFKFAFVRNPWDRLVSWWSMIERLRAPFDQGKKLNAFQTLVLTKTRSFEEFVRMSETVDDEDGRKSVHRNQIDYLVDHKGDIILDFVGRFEYLERDLNYALANRIGRNIELPHLNASIRQHYSRYYSRELAEEVARIYDRDIQAFEYRFDDIGFRHN